MTADVSLARRFAWGLSDIALMTWRNLMYYVRNPYWIFLAVIQPIMFVLLFVFVFGGAIETGADYEDYLLPGIIIQTVIFSSLGSGINIADDMTKGVMDRFRSLPIASGTVLAARTLSDTVRNAASVLIMVGVGYLVGYNFQGSPLAAAFAFGLTVLVGFAFSWIAAFIGLLVRSTQTAEVAGFTWSFPLVFASSIFVPIATMKKHAWLQAFARANPITLASDSVRDYSFGRDPGLGALWTVLWCVGIVLVFRTLAVWRFRRLT
jgi:ABC-2 type transport system permease protein